jgi:hypothetical protein
MSKLTNISSPKLIDILTPTTPFSHAPIIRKKESDYLIFHTTPEIHTIYTVTWYTLTIALVGLTYLRFKKPILIKKK